MRHKALIFCVVCAHLTFFYLDFSRKSPPTPKKSLIVRTYTPPPSKPQPKPVVVSKSEPQKKETNRISSYKAPSPSQKLKVLKELGEALKTIEAIQDEESAPSPLSLPQSIDTLQIDREESDKKEEGDYFLLLGSLLKEALELPELGQVKLELTLFNSGKVQKVRVLHSENETNKRYLERQLSFLSFPPFTEKLKKEHLHTFTLTFCNEN